MSGSGQRGRILRVRRLRHGLAALAAARASGHVRELESKDLKLGAMRDGLGAEPGLTSGAALAARGELAMRLQGARAGLSRSIDGARAAATLRETARLGARRDQDGAEILERRASAAATRAADAKAAAGYRPRRRRNDEGVDQ